VNWDTYQATLRLAPFGHANHEPIFVSTGLWVRNKRPVGKAEPTHLRLTLADRSGVLARGIAFRRGADASVLPAKVDVAYQIVRDDYAGEREVELRVLDLRPATG
jgi:single-stranded DNA-specific DHH superfamily exonuclease